MPRFPSDTTEEWSEPAELPTSDGATITISTTDPDEDWDWADED